MYSPLGSQGLRLMQGKLLNTIKNMKTACKQINWKSFETPFLKAFFKPFKRAKYATQGKAECKMCIDFFMRFVTSSKSPFPFWNSRRDGTGRTGPDGRDRTGQDGRGGRDRTDGSDRTGRTGRTGQDGRGGRDRTDVPDGTGRLVRFGIRGDFLVSFFLYFSLCFPYASLFCSLVFLVCVCF